MAFSPPKEYQIFPKPIPMKDFHEYSEDFVTRPPYQRKTVWSNAKQQSLLDSILRGYYIPKLVIRKVSLGTNKDVSEVVDGQQRITTVQNFFAGKTKLPKSLKDIHEALPGKTYTDLNADFRRYIDRQTFDVDEIHNIEDPLNPEHQRLATEIFWRLQQGESLTKMEVANARLSSLGRNFIVKYADDISFDYERYEPLDKNIDKHKFFKILNRPNDRMQHLSVLARMVLIEKAEGATDLKDSAVVDWIDNTVEANGIGNDGFEKTKPAKEVLSTLNLLTQLFDDDPMVQSGEVVQELKPDYVVLSLYMLARHLKAKYVLSDELKSSLRDFYIGFHERYRSDDVKDSMMITFRDNRQHSSSEVKTRELIIRQAFFEHLDQAGVEAVQKDSNRAFNESQRIKIYRDHRGLCQGCLADGKSEDEALVSWSQYEADHIFAHAKGGATSVDNGQLLCKFHNRSKGAS